MGDEPFCVRFRRLFELVETRVLKVAEMCQLGWGVRRRSGRGEEEMVGESCVLLHNVVLHVQVENQWHWLLYHVKGYTISGVYHYLISS